MKYKETIKTIVLTALVAGVLSFIAGVRYQTNVTRSFSLAQATGPIVQVQPTSK